MHRLRNPFSNGASLALAGIALVAYILRFVLVNFGADPIPAPYSDAEYYHVVAQNLARGDGYTYLNGPTAFWPPGFSFLLAIPYKLWEPSVKLALNANAIAGASTVLGTYAIGAQLWDRKVALIGSAILAVLPSHIFWSAVLLSEVVFTAFFTTVLALGLACIDRETMRIRPFAIAAFAVVFAAGLMVRGQMAVLLPVILAYWFMLGGRRQLLLVALVPVVLASVLVGAWAVRNLRAMDEPILLSSNFGYNLRIGHNDAAIGRFDFLPEFWPPGEEGNLTPEREIEFNRDGTRHAIDYAVSNPIREAKLSALKVYWMYRADIDSWIWIESFFRTPFPSIELRWAMVRTISASYYVLMSLAVAGCALMFRERGPRAMFVALLVALWTGVHVVFFGEPRFHVPLLPVFSLIAASFATWLGSNWRLLRESRTNAMRTQLAAAQWHAAIQPGERAT